MSVALQPPLTSSSVVSGTVESEDAAKEDKEEETSDQETAERAVPEELPDAGAEVGRGHPSKPSPRPPPALCPSCSTDKAETELEFIPS